MRKLNLDATLTNVSKMIANGKLYGFYGLTETLPVATIRDKYVTEYFRFSCEGDANTKADCEKKFVAMVYDMQKAYMAAMNLSSELFKIVKVKSKCAPYNTIVISLEVEDVKGAFATIVNCVGPDLHQFHASDVQVRANENAVIWKSLFDYDTNNSIKSDAPFAWIDVSTADKWLDKVYSARDIVNECIATAGEPDDETKGKLLSIMAA